MGEAHFVNRNTRHFHALLQHLLKLRQNGLRMSCQAVGAAVVGIRMVRCQHAQRAFALHVQEVIGIFHIQHSGGGIFNVVHNRGGNFNRRAGRIIHFQRVGHIVACFERHGLRVIKRDQPVKTGMRQNTSVFAEQCTHQRNIRLHHAETSKQIKIRHAQNSGKSTVLQCSAANTRTDNQQNHQCDKAVQVRHFIFFAVCLAHQFSFPCMRWENA